MCLRETLEVNQEAPSLCPRTARSHLQHSTPQFRQHRTSQSDGQELVELKIHYQLQGGKRLRIRSRTAKGLCERESVEEWY